MNIKLKRITLNEVAPAFAAGLDVYMTYSDDGEKNSLYKIDQDELCDSTFQEIMESEYYIRIDSKSADPVVHFTGNDEKLEGTPEKYNPRIPLVIDHDDSKVIGFISKDALSKEGLQFLLGSGAYEIGGGFVETPDGVEIVHASLNRTTVLAQNNNSIQVVIRGGGSTGRAKQLAEELERQIKGGYRV